MDGRRRTTCTNSTCTAAHWSCTDGSVASPRSFYGAKPTFAAKCVAPRAAMQFNIGEGISKRGGARAAAYEVGLGETKELIVALDCVEIDELAPLPDLTAAQDFADRIAAMLTKLIRSALADAP